MQIKTIFNPIRLYKWLLFLYLIIQIPFSNYAQNKIQYSPIYKTYTSKEGVTGGMPFAFHFDSYGYLWLGSARGFFRFSGNEFENVSATYNISNGFYPEVSSINNNIVTCSQKALYIYNHTTDSFSQYLFPDSLKADMLTRFIEFKGKLIIFNLFSKGGGPGTTITHLLFDPANNNFSLLRGFRPEQPVVNVTLSNPLRVFDYNGYVLEMLNDSSFINIKKLTKGGLTSIVYTNNNTWVAYDYEQKSFVKIFLSNGNYQLIKFTDWKENMYQIKRNHVVLNDGSILFFSNSRNLYRLKNNRIEKFLTIDDDFYCISLDRDGNCWLGGIKGIYKIFINKFTQVDFDTPENGNVIKLLCDKKGYLYASVFEKGISQLNEGLSILGESKITSIKNMKTHFDGTAPGGTVLSDNSLIFGTSPGFIIGKNNQWKFVNLNFPVLRDVIEKNDSTGIMLATIRGLEEWSPATGHISLNDSFRLGESRVSSFYIDNLNNIWLLTDKKTGYIKNNSFHEDSLLSTMSPYALVQDQKDNYWISTTKGLFISNKGVLSEPFPLIFKQGPYSMKITRNKILVMNTGGSLQAIDLNKFYTPEGKECHIFNAENGFTITETLRNCFTEDSLGRLWITSIGKLFFCYPENLVKNIITYSIKINKITTNHSESELSLNLNKVSSIKLLRGDNKLSFEYSVLTVSNSDQFYFRHRLIGLTDKWSVPTKEKKATYYNLSPGKYHFEVSASVDGINWTSNISSPSVIIRPLWHQSLLFKIIITLFVLILLFYLHTLRLKQALNIERLRKNISTDLHDDIGSTLSSINIYADLAKKEINNQVYLDSINQNINEVVSKLDDLVWSINPRNDALENIVNRLIAYAEPVSVTNNISFTTQLDDRIKTLRLPAEIKHHLYMIVKELVNNAIKHAQCKNIVVKFEQHNNGIFVIVSDDGIGYDPATIKKDRNGLSNISQRTSEIKAKLKIETASGKGTTTTIKIE